IDYERNANFTRIRLTASFHNPLLLDKPTPQARYRPTLFGGHGLGGLSKFGETDGCPCLWAGITALLCLCPTISKIMAHGYQCKAGSSVSGNPGFWYPVPAAWG